MRYKPTPRYEAYHFSDRKRQAFTRKLRKEQERFPLLAEQISEQQHCASVEERLRIERMRDAEARSRAFHAGIWRKVRAMYFALPAEDRSTIRLKWLNWRGPAEPTALAYLIRVHTGEYQAVGVAQREEAAAIRARLQMPDQATLQL
ncbi:hypothetical protein [Pseudomonas hunanensis]|uniref:hypothetical protein n=1 Tax=Pseudomonas hunanensis TaxID=1247546 RepID=UPI0030D7A0FA